MAAYLLDENYEDPAAVIIGSVLEQHLRLLCANNSIEITIQKSGGEVFKSASILNSELYKVSIYNKLIFNSVTTWLSLRNAAAHGNYGEYSYDQVKLMYIGVQDFVSKTNYN